MVRWSYRYLDFFYVEDLDNRRKTDMHIDSQRDKRNRH